MGREERFSGICWRLNCYGIGEDYFFACKLIKCRYIVRNHFEQGFFFLESFFFFDTNNFQSTNIILTLNELEIYFHKINFIQTVVSKNNVSTKQIY